MSKRIAIGDPHLSGFESDQLDENGLPKRLGYIIKSLDFIVSEGRKRNIKSYDILGDLINDKSVIYSVAQDAFRNFLVKNDDCNFTLLSGNHDLSSTGKLQKSAISVFNSYDNCNCVLYEPYVNGNITYVPFTNDFMSVLKTIEPNKILVSHLGLNEAQLQSGLSKVDKITVKDISKFKLAILGHYHKPQNFGNDKTNVFYGGSLICKDWNDKNEQKRFLIYDTETLEVESVSIECGIPQFKEYIIETSEQKTSILKQAELDRNNGHQVRIRNKTNEKIKEEVSGGVLILEQQEIDITDRGITIAQTKEEQLKKYLEIKQIPVEEHAEYLNLISKYDLLRKRE